MPRPQLALVALARAHERTVDAQADRAKAAPPEARSAERAELADVLVVAAAVDPDEGQHSRAEMNQIALLDVAEQCGRWLWHRAGRSHERIEFLLRSARVDVIQI